MKQKETPPPEQKQTEPDHKALAEQYYEQMVRLKAEFENYRKRIEKEKPEFIRWGKTEMLIKLLPLYDVILKAHDQLNKIMADKAACEGPTGELCKGLEIIFKEFSKLFESENVKSMESLGKPYDPMSHEVLGVVEGDDSNDGIVVDEIQKGFTCGDKMIRPARVRIAKKPEQKGND
ncbi:MAG: nucleotide exchange factor GrpE [Elusimicrobia bacterium]|nr:nucleotide exchange factor GrpE [Elusimicrobiota bacterium]